MPNLKLKWSPDRPRRKGKRVTPTRPPQAAATPRAALRWSTGNILDMSVNPMGKNPATMVP